MEAVGGRAGEVGGLTVFRLAGVELAVDGDGELALGQAVTGTGGAGAGPVGTEKVGVGRPGPSRPPAEQIGAGMGAGLASQLLAVAGIAPLACCVDRHLDCTTV